MLDTLTFLLEKLFLLAHIKLSSLVPPPGGRGERGGGGGGGDPTTTPTTSSTRRADREEAAGGAGGGPGGTGAGAGALPAGGASIPAGAGAPTRRFQRGDLLEVPRTLFTHFGIYLGEDRVAHLIPDILPALTSDPHLLQEMVTNTRLLLGVLCKRATIRVDTVEDFAYGSKVLLNAMDLVVRGGRGGPGGPHEPLPGEEVAVRAERLVGSVAYSLLWNNCEHFVTHCRYGRAQSLQTDQFCDWLKSLIRDQRVVMLAALIGLGSVVCSGVSVATATPALLVPFTLWMAS